MSWFSKNYEKAALGGTVAVALGLGYLGWSKLSSVESDFSLSLAGGGKNNTAVADAELIPKARQSMKIDRTWTQAIIDDRAVDLFTGIPLFVRSSDPEKPIDLFKDAPVHPPIPNTWWLTNRIDPGFGDSPSRDPDSDGFSNLDEFTEKTNPNDGKSHPELLAKLMFIKDESMWWVLRPGFGTEGKFPLTYQDARGQNNKIPLGGVVGPGELFYEKGAAAARYKLLGHEVRKELNKKINVEEERTYVRIEDQRPNKKGMVYEFPSPLSEERAKEHLKFDRTAVFSLEALGQSGTEFKVEENTTFALPPDSAKKDYLLKSVTPNSVVVEYGDAKGGRKTVEISKGSMPTLKD
jgi:hypothetical protein